MKALKRMFTAMIVAALGACYALPASAGEQAFVAPDFCADFQGLLENQLLTGLDDDIAEFIALLAPNTADINGSFMIDDSGEDLEVVVEGNGILDAGNELGLIAAILADPDFNNGVLDHATVRTAWEANMAQLEVDVGATLWLVLDAIAPQLPRMFNAYLMLGDGAFTVISAPSEENPDAPLIVEGTGSFGFVGAIFALINNALEGTPFPPISNPNLNPNNYISFSELLPEGDADGDGITNRCEFESFAPVICFLETEGEGEGVSEGEIEGAVEIITYVEAALDPSITPDPCPEPEGEGEGAAEGEGEGEGSDFIVNCPFSLSGANVVPPATTDASGQANFAVNLSQNTAVLSIEHTVEGALSAEIRQGEPGENGSLVIDLGDPTSPISVPLSSEDLNAFVPGETYHVVITSAEFADGEIRGNLSGCGGEGEGEGEGDIEGSIEGEGEGTVDPEGEGEGDIEGGVEGEGEGGEPGLCVVLLSGDQEVPPVATSATGVATFTFIEQANSVFMEIVHTVANPTMAHIHVGAPGVNGGIVLDLGSPESPIGINLSAAQYELFRTGHYINIHSSEFGGGEIRGDMDCPTLFEGEGEGIVDPEGEEGEGVVDPEGEGEGTVDPEGEGEGTVDPEGEGEGTVDPEGEGEGTVDPEGEGEGTVDPEGEGEGVVDPEGEEGEGVVDPEGEGEGVEPFEPFSHSADQNGDGLVNLSELLRVIQFFNVGGYRCQEGTEDGYAPGLGNTDCTPHASDYNPQNWQISLSELLRLIQFFNVGGYYACPEQGTEDGYCTGQLPG